MARLTLTEIGPQDAITTLGSEAVAQTDIVIFRVPIVAGFELHMIFGKIRAHEGIATTGEPAVVEATVILFGIAVVTFLRAGLFRTEVGALNVVATTGQRASTGTGIPLIHIAIITFLLGFDFSIPTFRRDFTDDDLLWASGQKHEGCNDRKDTHGGQAPPTA